MRYLRKFVQRVGLVSTMLIGGLLGGLMAPVPSEATSLSIDGVNIPLSDTTTGTGEGQKYTCETGYTSCWYITASGTATRTIQGTTGTWTVANVSSSNRARVRIYDVGGSPTTNVDKMNLTGIILTPPANNTAGKTTHIIINHTYINGQGVGNYQWGMGATGHFDPVGTDTALNNKFILTGKGRFNTPDSNDPEVVIGKLDLGPVDNVPPLAPGQNGIITQTVNVKSVKTNCNTNNSGVCKPAITYDYEVYVVGQDSLVLTDSLIGVGIVCTAAQEDPLIPPTLRFLMLLIDPSGNVPTHISDLYVWIDQMAVKYKLNPKQLAKVEKLKIALAKWFASTTCPGKVQQVLVNDSVSGVQQGLAAGGALVTTCADTNACGTITINKNTSGETTDTFTFNIIGPSPSTDSYSASIPMGNANSNSTVVTVTAGTYSITESPLSGWSLTSSSCGLEGPTTGVVVPAGGNVNCTFNNTKTFNSDDYRVISSPAGVKWADARTMALALDGGGAGWGLATITSAEEQAFIQTLLPNLPVTADTDYWIAGEQPDGSTEPGGNWRWATDNSLFYNNGVIYGYANWGTASTGPANEPNNYFGPEQNENHVTMDSRYGWGWNDLPGGFLAKGYVAKRFPVIQ